MTKLTTIEGNIEFRCICENVILGGVEDTLMDEGSLEARESADKYDIALKSATRDRAAYIVKYDCECGLDYMTLVRYGPNKTTEYRCECGYIVKLSQV